MASQLRSPPKETDVWSIHILQRRIQRNVGCRDIKVSVMCGLLFHITARFDGFTGSQCFSKVHPDIVGNSEGLPMECFNSRPTIMYSIWNLSNIYTTATI